MDICHRGHGKTNHRNRFPGVLWFACGRPNKLLSDSVTILSARGEAVTGEIASIKTVREHFKYCELLLKFADITWLARIERGSAKHDVVHHVTTTPGPPIYCRPRCCTRLPPYGENGIRPYVQQGIIWPSNNPWASALHLVPHIEDFVQNFNGKSIFSTLDLVRAYHLIPVAQDDIPKTAVATQFGLFEGATLPKSSNDSSIAYFEVGLLLRLHRYFNCIQGRGGTSLSFKIRFSASQWIWPINQHDEIL